MGAPRNDYQKSWRTTLMEQDSLLLTEFLKHGKKQGLEENFLREVFDFLFKNQYVMAGDRDHVRAQLLKLIRAETGD